MNNILIQRAIADIWSTPDQDKQYIIAPARLTGTTGARRYISIGMREYGLPLSTGTFHVYQVGHLNPALIGLLPISESWKKLSDQCAEDKMLIDVYSANGIRYPNFQCWYRYIDNKNLVFAVLRNPKIPIDLLNEKLFVRLYSDAYFESLRSDQLTDKVYNNGAILSTANEIVTLQNYLTRFDNQPGYLYLFVNGYLVNAINLFTVSLGDTVEYLFDPSVKKVVDLPFKDLRIFDSVLDKRAKYLVHFPDDGDHTIQYFDDVSFYIYAPQNKNFKGVYYHRNRMDAVRQVTHRDYSIQVPYVMSLLNQVPNNTGINNAILRLVINKSGYNRPLVYEHNRLQELYKMNETDILDALSGIDSTVSVWNAAYLEQSPYVQVIGHDGVQIPLDLVESMYGYYAASKILGDTPNLVQLNSGIKEVAMYPSVQENATVFEYNQEGVMLTYEGHELGEVHVCKHPEAYRVEALTGFLSDHFDDCFDRELALDSKYSYRFYVSPIIAGVKQNQWQDVTGSAMYNIANGKATWLVSDNDYEHVIRSDKNLVCYQESVIPYDGVINFPIYEITQVGGVTGKRAMIIPPGEIDIFLNGKELAEGLDYFIKFPYFVIANKEYLLEDRLTVPELITIRARGFCHPSMKYEKSIDKGYVVYGMLSANNQYDLRDDKVQHIVIDGCLKDKSELTFSEGKTGVEVGNLENGRPYFIKDLFVGMRGNTLTDTYILREASEVVDKEISDYMTLKIPEAERPNVFTIKEKYTVFSPLCCKLIYDMKSGLLSDDRIYTNISESTMLDIIKNHLWLMDYDPCSDENYPDNRFINIHPHNLMTAIGLDAFQYRLIRMVAKVVLKGRVDISNFVFIV